MRRWTRRSVLRLLGGPPVLGAVLFVGAADAEPATPTPDGVLLLEQTDLAWDDAAQVWRVETNLPEETSRRRLFKAKPDRTPPGRRLRRLVTRGDAAGLAGVLYDNRDGDHSTLRPDRHPDLVFVEYGASLREQGLHKGPAGPILFDRTTIGNASLAYTKGPFNRSLPRVAMTFPQSILAHARRYRANHLYVYPEHRDHDPERGSLYPAATPFVFVSQGSSGSDCPILGAIADILAALRPETRRRLEEEGLVAPAAQMLLRRSLVEDDDDYLTDAAHPDAIRGDRLDRARLISLAQALPADGIPPAPVIRIVEEPRPRLGVELFGDGLDERLFDTPHAVARLARSAIASRRYVLEGAARDPNGRPLSFHWRVLRGDPEGVRLRTTEDGRRAVVEIDWSTPRPTRYAPEIVSPRVDLGLFVHNGVAWSAPAFFSLYHPRDRVLRRDADGRLLEADYLGPRQGGRSDDPALFAARDWRDVYEYAEDGDLLGWTRHRKQGRSAYTAEGLRVLEIDDLGRAILAERVGYAIVGPGTRRPTVEERPTGERVRYAYDGPDDRVGRPAPAETGR